MALLTEKELNDLKVKKEQLEKKRKMSNTNYYGDNAYRNDLSPSEYMEISQEINEITKQILDAVIVPSIKINSRFSVECNGNLLSMLISVNPIEVEDFTCCTCDSTLGRALLDKKVNDIVTINTHEGKKTYKIISIEQY